MLSDERLAYLGGAEEFILTVTEKGIGNVPLLTSTEQVIGEGKAFGISM